MEAPLVHLEERSYLAWQDRFSGSSSVCSLDGSLSDTSALDCIVTQVPYLFLDEPIEGFDEGSLGALISSFKTIARHRTLDEINRSSDRDARSRMFIERYVRESLESEVFSAAAHALVGVPLLSNGIIEDAWLEESVLTVRYRQRGEQDWILFEDTVEVRDRRVEYLTPSISTERLYGRPREKGVPIGVLREDEV